MSMESTIDSSDLSLIKQLYVFEGLSIRALADKWEVSYRVMHSFIWRNKIDVPKNSQFENVKSWEVGSGTVPFDGTQYLIKKRGGQLYAAIPAEEFFEMQKRLEEMGK